MDEAKIKLLAKSHEGRKLILQAYLKSLEPPEPPRKNWFTKFMDRFKKN